MKTYTLDVTEQELAILRFALSKPRKVAKLVGSYNTKKSEPFYNPNFSSEDDCVRQTKDLHDRLQGTLHLRLPRAPEELVEDPYPASTLLAAMAVRSGVYAGQARQEGHNALASLILEARKETRDVDQFPIWASNGHPTFTMEYRD